MKNIGINIKVLFVFFLLANICDAEERGLKLRGRVYDGNNKYKGINDAELHIYISDKVPEVKYPINEDGGYYAVRWLVPQMNRVVIEAKHSEYIQSEKIELFTSRWEEKVDVRMSRNNVFAEDNFRRAMGVNLKSCESIDDAFALMIKSIELAPRKRYYVFLADVIGSRFRYMSENDGLPYKMISFLEGIYYDYFFKKIDDDEKCKFFYKIGDHISMSKVPLETTYGSKRLFDYACDAYDNVIKISPHKARGYQGKYLLQKKMQHPLDAIKTIEKFFLYNDSVVSEMTVKGLLVDWVDLIRVFTGFKGSEKEVKNHAKNGEYKKLWHALYITMKKYKNYYNNEEVRGNQNLREAFIIAKRVSTNDSR